MATNKDESRMMRAAFSRAIAWPPHLSRPGAPGDTERLLHRAEQLAGALFDGHLTIMRFTTCWKVMLGTPNLDGGVRLFDPEGGRGEVGGLPAYPTLDEALQGLFDTVRVAYDRELARGAAEFPRKWE